MDQTNDKNIDIIYKDKRIAMNNLIDFIINFLVDINLSNGDFNNECDSSNKGGCNPRHDKQSE